jgi:hypothetical protein
VPSVATQNEHPPDARRNSQAPVNSVRAISNAKPGKDLLTGRRTRTPVISRRVQLRLAQIFGQSARGLARCCQLWRQRVGRTLSKRVTWLPGHEQPIRRGRQPSNPAGAAWSAFTRQPRSSTPADSRFTATDKRSDLGQTWMTGVLIVNLAMTLAMLCVLSVVTDHLFGVAACESGRGGTRRQ